MEMKEESSDSPAAVDEPVLPARLRTAALIRRLTACEAANEALDIFLEEAESGASPSSAAGLSEVSVYLLAG